MKMFAFPHDDRARIKLLLLGEGANEEAVDFTLFAIEGALTRQGKPLDWPPSTDVLIDRLQKIERLSSELVELLSEVRSTGIASYQAHLMRRVVDRCGVSFNENGLARPGGRAAFSELLRLLTELNDGSAGSLSALRTAYPPSPPKRGRKRDGFTAGLSDCFVDGVRSMCKLPIDDRLGRSPSWLVEAFEIILKAAQPGNRDNDRHAAERLIRASRRRMATLMEAERAE